MKNNVIFGINGPVITVKGKTEFKMMEMVHVGEENLVGEIIGITDEYTTVQVYEETTGLRPGDPITGTGSPMNVLLGPGILDNMFDGIERPLKAIEKQSGAFINRGSKVDNLDSEKLWDVTMKVKVGDRLSAGEIYATIPETRIIEHRLMVPPSISGEITEVMPDGQYRLFDTVAKIRDELGKEHNLTLCQQWPIRYSRPIEKRLSTNVPLITGQRTMDTMFPIAKGGTAA
ncbi:MAG: V-type ATP synthase subunit A, partial [Ruminococcus sp.]|nr:V-type ATP synthase subunit A [Ruminococcus sp.]